MENIRCCITDDSPTDDVFASSALCGFIELYACQSAVWTNERSQLEVTRDRYTGEREDRHSTSSITPSMKMEMWQTWTSSKSEQPNPEGEDFGSYDNRKHDTVERFKDTIHTSSAYRWLLATLRNRSLLTFSKSSCMANITKIISEALPQPDNFSEHS